MIEKEEEETKTAKKELYTYVKINANFAHFREREKKVIWNLYSELIYIKKI